MYFPFYNYFQSLLCMCVGEERYYKPCHGLFQDVYVILYLCHRLLWKMTVQFSLSANAMLQFTNITVWVMTHSAVKYVDPGQSSLVQIRNHGSESVVPPESYSHSQNKPIHLNYFIVWAQQMKTCVSSFKNTSVSTHVSSFSHFSFFFFS